VVDATYWSALTDTAADTTSSQHKQPSFGANSVTVYRTADDDRECGTVASSKPQASVLFHTHFTNNTSDIQVATRTFSQFGLHKTEMMSTTKNGSNNTTQ